MRKKGDLSEFECGVVVGVIGRVLVFKKRFICWEFPTQLFRGFTQDGVKKGKGKGKKNQSTAGILRRERPDFKFAGSRDVPGD